MPCDEYWPKLRLIMYQQNIDDKENLRLTAAGIVYRMFACGLGGICLAISVAAIVNHCASTLNQSI